MTVVGGRRWTRKDFLNKVDDCVTSGTKLLDDFEFLGGFLVGTVESAVGDEADWLPLKEETLADGITGTKDIFNGLGVDGGRRLEI